MAYDWVIYKREWHILDKEINVHGGMSWERENHEIAVLQLNIFITAILWNGNQFNCFIKGLMTER